MRHDSILNYFASGDLGIVQGVGVATAFLSIVVFTLHRHRIQCAGSLPPSPTALAHGAYSHLLVPSAVDPGRPEQVG